MSINFNKKVDYLRKKLKFLSFIKIDISFFALFLLAYFLEEVRLYFVYVIFIILHEMSHFYVAKKLGYLPQKIHFTFFGASLEGYDDFLFRDEIKIILAGPFFNLFVVILCYLSFWFNPESFIYLSDILVANLSIFLFNVLPIYPLDSGRFFLAFYSKKFLRADALRKVKNMSLCFLIVVFAVFLVSFFYSYNFSLGFVCVNLTRLLFSSSKETSYKRQLYISKKIKNLKKGLFERTIYVKDDLNYFELFKFIDDSHYFRFVFLDSSGNIIKEISETELYRLCDFI